MEDEVEVVIGTLMNQNVEILNIKFSKGGRLLAVNNPRFSNWHLAPYEAPSPTAEDLVLKISRWLDRRGIPASRKHLNQVKMEAKVTEALELALKANALSLSDQYWIRFSHSEKWEDLNFFDNTFSDDIGKFMVEGKCPESLNLKTPGSSLNGIMPKRWKIENGTRILLKGQKGRTDNNESFREVYASLMFSQVLRSSEFVMYSLFEAKKGSPLSCCDNFVEKHTEYTPMYSILERAGRIDTFIPYQYLKDIYKDNYHVLDWMLLIDYILVNIDRHYYNFGMIRSSINGELICPAPIFDTGACLFHNVEIKEDTEYTQPRGLCPLIGDWDERHSEIDFPRYKEGLLKLLSNYEKLFHFVFETCNTYNNLEWRAQILVVIRTNILHLLSKC